MHENADVLLARSERTLRERIRPAICDVVSSADVSAWRQPRENGRASEPLNWRDLDLGSFVDFEIGASWGAAWETTWFLVRTRAESSIDLAPADRVELVIDLGFEDHSVGFHCEALVRTLAGRAVKALNPKNRWIPIPDPATQNAFLIEAAANPLLLGLPPFQPTTDGDVLTSSTRDLFTLRSADLIRVNGEVEALAADLEILYDVVKNADAMGDDEWRTLLIVNAALDVLDLADIRGTAAEARAVLAPRLATPAHDDAHRVVAVGHAHIDSAWLWPLRETRRKVVRTLANVVALIESGYPLVFALPAAQHAAWLKEDDPELFERMRACVDAGSIVPVGGMWVEPDAVLPGGESLCRQFVEGLTWFEDELGATCEQMWLPDSFGYTAALPQIAREAGIASFLTQKISWNQTNAFPHTTLWWEGIDGTRIYTHFPPADTYNSAITGEELARLVSGNKDKGRASTSLLPFGYGDGGGGPTREMLDRIERLADLRGAPRVEIAEPSRFFETAKAELPDPDVWVGELYLERHRGTLTSQVEVKRANRRSEALLREAELWCATAAVRCGAPYPHDELREAWRSVLLLQFHDILPGSSIAWVYRDAAEIAARVHATCERLIASALAMSTSGNEDIPLVANASSFASGGVPALGIGPETREPSSLDIDGRIVRTPHLEVAFDEAGALASLIDRRDGRQMIPEGARGGVLHLHQDFPNMWDAWDIDSFYRGSVEVVSDMRLVGITSEDGRAVVTASARFGASTANLRWTIPSDAATIDLDVDVDFRETEKILKLAFPVDIHTDHAQFDIQMGHLDRPTHVNTSWDAARFEVSARTWVRLADAKASLSIANDAVHGWDVMRRPGADRGTWSLVRASLVRSARYPDPNQDHGRHHWTFRLRPGGDVLDARADGQALHLGTRRLRGTPVAPLIEVDGAVVESVAMAPDESGDIVVRLFEAEGARSEVVVRAPEFASASTTDLRYRPSADAPEVRAGDGAFRFELGSFQIATLRLSRTEPVEEPA